MTKKASQPQLPAEADFEPRKQATAQLMLHIAQKASQVGSLAGVPLVFAQALRASFSPGAAPPFTAAAALRTLAITAAVGTVTLTTLGGAKVAGLDRDGVEDRVYRIHYNQGVQRCDRFANGGALIGGGIATAVHGARPSAMLGGMAAGTALGVLMFATAASKRDTMRS
jgi:Protein of unknown function (DUF1757)